MNGDDAMSIDGDTVEFQLPEQFAGQFFAPAAPAVRVTVGGATHPGKVRSNNEDHFLVCRRSRWQEVLVSNLPTGLVPSTGDEDFFLIVADGIGGDEFGEVASRRVIQAGWDLMAQASSWVMKLADLDAQEICKRMNAYVQRIEQQLAETAASEADLIGAGTTVVAAHLLGRDALIANVGDSRAYVCRGGSCRQVTHDHTLGQTLEDAGIETDNIEHLHRLLLNCFSIEKGSRAVPELHHERLEVGDRLLLCTDGLSDMLSDGEMAGIISAKQDVQAACDALIERALHRGGQGNVTVALAAIEPVDPTSIESED